MKLDKRKKSEIVESIEKFKDLLSDKLLILDYLQSDGLLTQDDVDNIRQYVTDIKIESEEVNDFE